LNENYVLQFLPSKALEQLAQVRELVLEQSLLVQEQLVSALAQSLYQLSLAFAEV
jgi:hypothetical protein